MAHHIGALQVRKRHIVDAAQNSLDIGQAAATTHQVALAQIAGDHEFGIKAQTRQEHLHLLARAVLSFIKYYERVVESPSSHVSQRNDFYHLFFLQPERSVASEYIKQCVIKRS